MNIDNLIIIVIEPCADQDHGAGTVSKLRLWHSDLKAIVFNFCKGFIGNNRVLLEKRSRSRIHGANIIAFKTTVLVVSIIDAADAEESKFRLGIGTLCKPWKYQQGDFCF